MFPVLMFLNLAPCIKKGTFQFKVNVQITIEVKRRLNAHVDSLISGRRAAKRLNAGESVHANVAFQFSVAQCDPLD